MNNSTETEDPDFANWLRVELARRELTQSQFAELAGLQTSHVSRVLLRQTPPTPKFCKGVARALNLPEAEVLALAGIFAGDSLADKILSLLPWLTDQEKTRFLTQMEELANKRRKTGKRGG